MIQKKISVFESISRSVDWKKRVTEILNSNKNLIDFSVGWKLEYVDLNYSYMETEE